MFRTEEIEALQILEVGTMTDATRTTVDEDGRVRHHHVFRRETLTTPKQSWPSSEGSPIQTAYIKTHRMGREYGQEMPHD